MKILQLYRDTTEIIASDGIMYVDGRLSLDNIKQAVIERNKTYVKNFPHKVCNGFTIYQNRIGGAQSRLYSL